VRLVDVWCPDCKKLTDYGPIEGVLTKLDALRAERDAYMSDAARLADLWASVPWVHLREATQRLRAYQHNEPNASVECLADGIDDWIDTHAPQPEQEVQS
jgi:hypothetical protein